MYLRLKMFYNLRACFFNIIIQFLKTLPRLTLYLLVLSADNFRKQFGPRQKVGPYRSVSKLFDTLMVFLKDFSKKLILKKLSRQQKSMQNYLETKELMVDLF